MVLNLTNLSSDAIINLAEKIKTVELLEKLRNEHEMLVVRSEIEGKENKEEIDKIKSEILRLEEQTKDTSDESLFLKDIYPKQAQIKNRLEKLEKKRQNIQPEVYDSLKDEYLSELTLINEQLNATAKHLEITRQQTQPLIQVLNFQIEELTVRKEIEDLSEEEFNSKMFQLKKELSEKEKFLSAVEYLLQQVKQ